MDARTHPAGEALRSQGMSQRKIRRRDALSRALLVRMLQSLVSVPPPRDLLRRSRLGKVRKLH
jgi:hypothetical protein